jgi:hypothetical protein
MKQILAEWTPLIMLAAAYSNEAIKLKCPRLCFSRRCGVGLLVLWPSARVQGMTNEMAMVSRARDSPRRSSSVARPQLLKETCLIECGSMTSKKTKKIQTFATAGLAMPESVKALNDGLHCDM